MPTDWDAARKAVEDKEESDSKISDAEVWKPGEGEILVGTLLEAKYVDTSYGPAHLMQIETPEDGVMTVWCSSKMLKDAVLDQAPAVGTWVSIKYGGKKEPKTEGGRAYNAYYMQCGEADFEYWHNLSRKTSNEEASEQTTTDDGNEDPF